MPRYATINEGTEAVVRYLNEYAGDCICARQIWYECMEGYGKPTQYQLEIIQEIIEPLPDWCLAGDIRYEKYGVERSYKKTVVKQPQSASSHVMSQHVCKVNQHYQTPDGRILKIALAEVYNIRCFEIKDGHMVGPMIKIHPQSDLAKSLIEVTN